MMQASRTATATDTRYLVVSTDEAIAIARATEDVADCKGCRHEHTPELQGMDSSVSHIGRIEYTDGDEVYIWLQIGVKNGLAYATVYPQPPTGKGYIHPKYELGAVSSLREAAAVMAVYLPLAACYLVKQQRTTARDLVSY